MKRFFRPSELIQTALALALVFLCLLASQWQLHRGQARSDLNKVITQNLAAAPLNSVAFLRLNPSRDQLRSAKISGNFDLSHQLLVRDRYNNGVYGFEVLQLFQTANGAKYWVNRGWVKAGKDAKTAPTIPPITNQLLSINIRIRAENLAPQIAGSFFAVSSPKRISHLGNVQGVGAANYYLDLLPSDLISPLTEIETPEISNGPHFAYAIQWLAFAVMICIGRFLLFRNPKRLALE